MFSRTFSIAAVALFCFINPICGQLRDSNPVNEKDDRDFHQAAIYTLDGTFRFLGSGTIISDDLILTCAHIFYQKGSKEVQLQNIHVMVGRPHRLIMIALLKHTAQNVMIHEEYRNDDIGAGKDIALIKLTHKLDLNNENNKIKKAELPSEFESMNMEALRDIIWEYEISGWGKIKVKGQGQETLHYATKVFMVPRDQLKLAKDYRNHYENLDDKILVGQKHESHEEAPAPLSGDSGSALIGKCDGSEIIFGIAHGGPAGDLEELVGLYGYPSVYTNVMKYLDWIQYYMENPIVDQQPFILYGDKSGIIPRRRINPGPNNVPRSPETDENLRKHRNDERPGPIKRRRKNPTENKPKIQLKTKGQPLLSHEKNPKKERTPRKQEHRQNGNLRQPNTDQNLKRPSNDEGSPGLPKRRKKERSPKRKETFFEDKRSPKKNQLFKVNHILVAAVVCVVATGIRFFI